MRRALLICVVVAVAGCASPRIDTLPLPDTSPPTRFPEPDPPVIERSSARQSSRIALPASLSIPQRIELGQFNIPEDGLYVVESTSDFAEWVEVHRFWVPQSRHVTERQAVISYDFDVEWQAPITAAAFFRVRQIPLNPPSP